MSDPKYVYGRGTCGHSFRFDFDAIIPGEIHCPDCNRTVEIWAQSFTPGPYAAGGSVGKETSA